MLFIQAHIQNTYVSHLLLFQREGAVATLLGNDSQMLCCFAKAI